MMMPLPIPLIELLELSLKVQDVLTVHPCDDTLINTKYYLRKSQQTAAVMPWLKQHGLICDCKFYKAVWNMSDYLSRIHKESEKDSTGAVNLNNISHNKGNGVYKK